MARKDRSSPKETPATGKYEGRGPGSHLPSGDTGRGVHGRGEPKGVNPEGAGKPTSPQPGKPGEGRGPKRARSHSHETRNQAI